MKIEEKQITALAEYLRTRILEVNTTNSGNSILEIEIDNFTQATAVFDDKEELKAFWINK